MKPTTPTARPPRPPFDAASAVTKVRAAEDAWNGRDPARVDVEGHWTRSHGNEQWEFDESGLMRRREASVNDVPIDEAARRFRWPLGPRPLHHPGLTELGL